MHKPLAWTALALLLLSGLPPAGALTIRPDWSSTPSRQDVMRAYPQAAREKRVEGHVILDCAIAQTGQLRDCRFEAEAPPGWGFGEAAKIVARSFVLRIPNGGNEAAIERMKVPIAFRLPEEN